MDLKDFIGKVVISSKTKRRYIVQQIDASIFKVLTEKVNENGTHSCYIWECINGDPISNGDLIFEDASMTEPFKKAYNAHLQTKAAYWEDYGYWMRKD